ncbi:MAG TPA: outer membrane lipoprotein-sorting protein [Gammaproteobacteria bacterium]|nr:outer membrane lipoprotein-sorting protein [Gammaproteobacteria bacterium]
MMKKHLSGVLAGLLLSGGPAFLVPAQAAPEQALDGTEIFKRCGYKYPGEDQRSKFTVLLRDRQGKVKKSQYLRFWKDFKGRDGIADKMLLFTIYPPDAKGAAFMRVAYTAEKDYKVDQWIYLPVLRKIRRVSIRDPGDNFLNSNLTYADVGRRALEDDVHKFLGVKEIKGLSFYVVESIPKEKRPLYSKRVFWFLKTPDWDDCVNTRIDYYDLKGELLKEQFIKWQKVGKAWIWDRVLVRNRRNLSASVFQISDVQINTGLPDNIFTARTLRRGPSAVPDYKPPRPTPTPKKSDESFEPD